MKSWKVEEKRVAELFGLLRRGANFHQVGTSDVMSQDGSNADIYIEVKSWKHMPLIKVIEKARRAAQTEANNEGKTFKPWVLAIHCKGSPNRFGVVDLEYLSALFDLAPKEVVYKRICTKDINKSDESESKIVFTTSNEP